ncbi:acetyl-CoA hydrolase/transferase C-terminal domain-containing protein [Caproicibacterium sp. NSD3]
MYNGIGGSGDYARNAAISIFMTTSTEKNDIISNIVPMVSHTDHDVDVIVTKNGVADLRDKAPRERAQLIIENCAHPAYRGQLQAYFKEVCEKCGSVQTPHLLNNRFSFHNQYLTKETMEL